MPLPKADLRPVDPDVKVPAAVKATVARANEIHAQAYNTGEKPVENADDGANPPAPETTPAPQPPAPSAKEPPAPQPAPSEPPAQVTPDGNQPTIESLQEEIRTLQHNLRSMVGRDRVHRTVKAELDQANERIRALEATLASVQTNNTGSTPPANSTLTPEEIEQFGPEFLAVVGKKAQEALQPYIRELEQKIVSLGGTVKDVGQNLAVTAAENMYKALDERVPNWREINKNQKFLDWLDLPDPYSGVIRNEMLQAAFGRNQYEQVIAFFNGFLKDEAVTAPQPTPQPPAQPAPQAPKVELVSLAAPNRAKDTGSETPVEKPTFTPVQITQFYADVAAGKYRGKDAEKLAMETQIFEAQRSGRVIR